MHTESCENCKYWDSWTWACSNADSLYCADFVNMGCEHKEKADGKEDTL